MVPGEALAVAGRDNVLQARGRVPRQSRFDCVIYPNGGHHFGGREQVLDGLQADRFTNLTVLLHFVQFPDDCFSQLLDVFEPEGVDD
jgi:hypothetical protein